LTKFKKFVIIYIEKTKERKMLRKILMVILGIAFLACVGYLVVPTSWIQRLVNKGTDEYRVKTMMLTIYYGQPEDRALLALDSNGIAFVTAWFREPADTLIRKHNEGKPMNVGPAIIRCVKDTDEIISWTIIR
jgi:hypothetical protein